MVGIDGPSAVELLDQEHPGHGVRQSHVGQADALVSGLPELWFETVWAAND
jgi:hypothetical protein